jgi:hypothetical protein
MPQYPPPPRTVHPWIGYLYRCLLALVVALALAATPMTPPGSSGDHRANDGGQGVDPLVNWNS